MTDGDTEKPDAAIEQLASYAGITRTGSAVDGTAPESEQPPSQPACARAPARTTHPTQITQDHKQSGETTLRLLFVSHDLSVVRHITQRVAVMRHGTIVETGPTEQIYADPQHDYTRELLASVPRLKYRPERRR